MICIGLGAIVYVVFAIMTHDPSGWSFLIGMLTFSVLLSYGYLSGIIDTTWAVDRFFPPEKEG